MTTPNFTTDPKKYLELIFPANVAAADLEILEAATLAKPGRAKLRQAVQQDTAMPYAKRLLSSNGRNLIGIIVEVNHLGQLPAAPYSDGYWLLEEGPGDA